VKRKPAKPKAKHPSPPTCYGKLRKYVGTGAAIRVGREGLQKESLNGFLIELSTQFGVMHCFHDFMPDGFSLFRIADVTSVRSNKYERFWDKMLRAEGLLGGLTNPPNVDLKTLPRALNSIASAVDELIVECERQRNADDAWLSDKFFIGRAIEINKEDVLFVEFDALGRWEKWPTAIPLDEITLVQFDTPYINHFRKHLTGRPPESVTR
jgi:hypothetical protein